MLDSQPRFCPDCKGLHTAGGRGDSSRGRQHGGIGITAREYGPAADAAPPACPACKSPMRLRTGKKKTAVQFWGCSKYPQCHGILWIREAT